MTSPTSIKAPFPYFGGKSRVADVIWERFGDVSNYVEPFAGSLAVLLKRPSPPQTETVNDIDCYLANFWRAIAGDPEGVAEWADWPVNEADLVARHQWLINQSEFRERMKREPHFFDAKIAGWWVWGISQWIGSGWCSRTAAQIPSMRSEGIHRISMQRPHLRDNATGIHRKLPHLRNEGMGTHRESLSNRTGQVKLPDLFNKGIHADSRSNMLDQYFQELAERLRRVRVCCGDWTRVTGPSVTFLHGTTAIFLDPPYDMRVTAKDGGSISGEVYTNYDNDLSPAVRQWAIENGNNPLLRICLAGYEEEHESLIPDDWERVCWKAQGGYANQGEGNHNSSRERLWFSPYCLRPEENFFRDSIWQETAIHIG